MKMYLSIQIINKKITNHIRVNNYMKMNNKLKITIIIHHMLKIFKKAIKIKMINKYISPNTILIIHTKHLIKTTYKKIYKINN